jgi:carbamoyl-phosphate synthase large subunit
MTKIKILISSAGRRVALLQCFRNSARELSCDLTIIAVDSRPNLSAACAIADRYYYVPPCDQPAFVPRILQIAEAERVKLVVPTIDPELLPLSEAAEYLRNIDCRVVLSSPHVLTIARDKLQTIAYLQSIGIPCPRTYTGAEFESAQSLQGPLVAKPRYGSSSEGLIFGETIADFHELRGRVDYLIQERVLGTEYTVNMFLTARGELHAAVPHQRLETRSGEVSKALTCQQAELQAYAAKLAQSLPGPVGPLCFQAIVPKSGKPQVFEINARFGGGYPICHRAGGHFTTYLLEEALGKSASPCETWTAGILMLRYDAAIFREYPCE